MYVQDDSPINGVLDFCAFLKPTPEDRRKFRTSCSDHGGGTSGTKAIQRAESALLESLDDTEENDETPPKIFKTDSESSQSQPETTKSVPPIAVVQPIQFEVKVDLPPESSVIETIDPVNDIFLNNFRVSVSVCLFVCLFVCLSITHF